MDIKKWKSVAIAVAILALIACAIGFAVNQANSQQQNKTELGAAAQETMMETDGPDKAADKKANAAEAEDDTTLPKDSDQTTFVIPNEDGVEIKVQIGVEESSDVFGEDEEYPADTNHPGNQTTEPPAKPNGEGNAVTPTQPNTEADAGQPQTPRPIGPDRSTTYEEYLAMSAEEQVYFYYSFASAEDFYDWYNAAKEAYEAETGDIIVGDEPIDMDKIFGRND